MKKLLSLLLCAVLLLGCSSKFDDSALRNDLNDLENRVTKLEEICKQMNNNISSLQTIVTALQSKLSITKVEQLSDGYIIHFSDNTTATIKNGKDSGSIPVIGVKKDTDGIYYWTKDGQWLTDAQGKKVKAQGTDGKDGVDGEDGTDGTNGTNGTNGKDGITPQLKIENGRWLLSMDSGKTWTDIGQATGADGTNGENGTDGTDGKDGTNGIFKSVTEDDNNVYFTLADDSVITIPKGDKSHFSISFDTTDIAILNAGETKTVSYTITGATEKTVVKAISQDGWKATVNATSTSAGTITITAPNPIVDSEILVFANDGSYRTVMATLNCSQGEIIIADNSFDTTPTGGIQEVKLTTNLDYTVEIPDNAKSWLSVVQTRAMREDTIAFNVAANDGIQRFASVALKDKQGNTLQTIIFRQLGTCTEIHVDTKGELETVLADYDYANIKSLKITGVLNDVDFLFIYQKMPNLRNIDLAEVNILELPGKAFYQSNIEEIILPKTLSIIGQDLFQGCSIKSLEIPATIKNIEYSAFRDCRSLKTVTFEKGSTLQTIGGDSGAINSYGTFSGCRTLTSIEIPASVEILGPRTFENCSALTTIIFEKGSKVKTIGGGFHVENSVTTTVWGMFMGCKSLASIEIPASVENIECNAFRGCSSLASVTFENGANLQNINGASTPIGTSGRYDYHGAFSNCAALKYVEIPASTKTIKAYSFKGCCSIVTVVFEKMSQLKDIGADAFSGLSALTSITLPASVEIIQDSAFADCSSLNTVSFDADSNVKVIGNFAFARCPLTSIRIPAKVETIASSAFSDCLQLATVTFEKGAIIKALSGAYSNYQYSGIFSKCPIKTIEIPASVEKISPAAFAYCTSLATVTFEKGSKLQVIGGDPIDAYNSAGGAFHGCKLLTTIDASECQFISSIESDAFGGCNLQLFKIGTPSRPKCYTWTFSTASYSILKVPAGSVSLYKGFAGWSAFSSISSLDE